MSLLWREIGKRDVEENHGTERREEDRDGRKIKGAVTTRLV
jgi:hypothetical protein